tara:strand:+ start:1148 stop:3694 length:2547 start_codon:yes stop_codon:yes gene_type:complete
MTKWQIKKINNKNSTYDFRLISTNKDYSNIDFTKYNLFRILVSLSSHLTNGIIFKDKFYIIKSNKNIPTIFDFSINIYSKVSNNYMTLNQNMTKIIFNKNKETFYIETLYKPNTKVFSSLFLFDEVNSISSFITDNKKSYIDIKPKYNNKYIITGWINHTHLILDLLKYNKTYKSSTLTRCKIYDNMIINQIKFKKIKSYCLFIVNFNDKYNFNIEHIIPVTFDEYLSYIYDLMLPYKYDLNDIIHSKEKMIDYKNHPENIAFAIDPDGSKDRDDAIAAFYLDKNMSITKFSSASYVKLVVHISDTMSYIQPSNYNYYYNYSKYKYNTDYLDKYNLPMMDRMLSEDYLSLDGYKNNAITINITYKITNLKKFLIHPFPEKVSIHRSKNLKIIGTTYKKFSESFALKPEKMYDNNHFINRTIINCNKKLNRDFNEFIYEGSSDYSNNLKKNLANNLKQLYIFFVNSLNHTGKDTLILLPSNMIREKGNIYLDFSPVDMWSHSLIEYTALEANIYFSHMQYLSPVLKNNKFSFNRKDIVDLNMKIGNKNIKLLLDNSINNKNISLPKKGIYRNLYSPSRNMDFYLNSTIRKMLVKILKKDINNNVSYKSMIKKFLNKFGYDNNNIHLEFLKLMLALRQVLLLIKSKTNLDISTKLINKELKMKAKYQYFPFGHFDICSLFYTHATSPMRRFIDINVHNLIFNNKLTNYIFANINLDDINMGVQRGKYIHHLVNNKKFIDFINYNKKLVTPIKIIDSTKDNTLIGFVDLATFHNFNSIYNTKLIKIINKNKTNVITLTDNYDIPIIKLANKNDRLFNIFFHMLRKEDIKVQKKCKIFLEKIFHVKELNEVC